MWEITPVGKNGIQSVDWAISLASQALSVNPFFAVLAPRASSAQPG
jgi:hypothetical protein